MPLTKPPGADWKGMGDLQEGLLLPPGFGSINRQCDPGRKGWETKLRQCCGQRPGIGWNINAPCVRLKNKKKLIKLALVVPNICIFFF